MEPVISSIPMMVVEGNHEIEEELRNETFAAYRARFAFPSAESESGSASPFYYSFDRRRRHHVVMLASYADYRRSGAQYRWLEEDLTKLDRAATPWLVAGWHAPWYTTYRAHYREAECMRVSMEELLYAYAVDVVFTGHVHAYERSNRVFNYTLDACWPVHISVGAGATGEKLAPAHADDPGHCPDPTSTPDPFMGGRLCAANFTTTGRFCWDRQPEYSAYTHALWRWHRNLDLRADVAADEVYIVRELDKCLATKPARLAY